MIRKLKKSLIEDNNNKMKSMIRKLGDKMLL